MGWEGPERSRIHRTVGVEKSSRVRAAQNGSEELLQDQNAANGVGWKGPGRSQRGALRTSAQRQQFVLQHVPRVRALVHQVQLGDHTDGPQACGTADEQLGDSEPIKQHRAGLRWAPNQSAVGPSEGNAENLAKLGQSRGKLGPIDPKVGDAGPSGTKRSQCGTKQQSRAAGEAQSGAPVRQTGPKARARGPEAGRAHPADPPPWPS